ncbi:MAG: hypothetical protein IJA07_06285 [Agathobacter sp.]|nr:hypothetical protein [Agathobacter sp.]
MKKNGLIIGLVIVAIIVLAVYFANRPMSLGNIQQKYTEATTNISKISFSGKEGERIKFSFRSNVKSGNLEITLKDSAGNIVYELDKARELETFYSFEKTDTYTLQAKYTDFVGEYKINVYEVK